MFWPSFGYLKAEFEGESYFQEPISPMQLKNYFIAKVDWNDSGKYKIFDYTIQTGADIYVDKSRQLYFRFPEMFLSYKHIFKKNWMLDLKNVEVSLGRRIYTWNHSDKFWQLGLWNSLNNWNPLQPEENGLVGTFFDLEAEKWSVNLFVGHVYLPSRNSELRSYENDITGVTSLISSSRWSGSVPKRLNVLGSSLNIDYLIDSPLIFDIIFQQSYIFSFKTWSQGPQNYWMKWSISYKPDNSPFFVRNNQNILKLSQDSDKDLTIAQTITFFPVKHRLVSAEWGIDYREFSTTFSVSDSFVHEVENLPEEWVFIKDRVSMTYISAFLKYESPLIYNTKNTFELGYIKSWFKKNNEDVAIEEDASVIGDYKVLNGVRLNLFSSIRKGLKKQADIGLSYWYSFFSKGAWLSLDVDYFISPVFSIGGGLSILGSDVPDSRSFFNKFRANDHMFWRLTYAF